MEVIDVFLEHFETIRIHHARDQFEAKGRQRLAQKIFYFVNNQLPIEIVLPAFPIKSPNNVDKVLGKLPDRAEEIALERLETFCREVEKSYPIGVRMIIFSDGRVFNDIFGETVREIQTYKQALKEMVQRLGYKHISFDGLENYIKSDNVIEDMMKHHGGIANRRDSGFRRELKLNEDMTATYNGFKMFLRRDLALDWTDKSKKYIDKQCAKKAKQMMTRNVAFSNLVNKEYPHAIRFSIHSYNNAGPKYGIYLLPQESSDMELPGTPWHRVIAEDLDGSVHSLELRDVDQSKYTLYSKYGRSWGYVEKKKKRGSVDGYRRMSSECKRRKSTHGSTEMSLLNLDA